MRGSERASIFAKSNATEESTKASGRRRTMSFGKSMANAVDFVVLDKKNNSD